MLYLQVALENLRSALKFIFSLVLSTEELLLLKSRQVSPSPPPQHLLLMNANYHKGAEQISTKEAFSTNKMVTTRLVRHEDAIYEKQSGRGTVVESAKSRVVAALLLLRREEAPHLLISSEASRLLATEAGPYPSRLLHCQGNLQSER